MSGFKDDSTRFLKLIIEVQLQKEMNAQKERREYALWVDEDNI